MRKIGIAGLLVFAATMASAKDITLNEKEQLNIAQICEIAARSPNVSLEITANIAGWCVQWAKRVNEQQQQSQPLSQPQPLPAEKSK